MREWSGDPSWSAVATVEATENIQVRHMEAEKGMQVAQNRTGAHGPQLHLKVESLSHFPETDVADGGVEQEGTIARLGTASLAPDGHQYALKVRREGSERQLEDTQVNPPMAGVGTGMRPLHTTSLDSESLSSSGSCKQDEEQEKNRQLDAMSRMLQSNEQWVSTREQASEATAAPCNAQDSRYVQLDLTAQVEALQKQLLLARQETDSLQLKLHLSSQLLLDRSRQVPLPPLLSRSLSRFRSRSRSRSRSRHLSRTRSLSLSHSFSLARSLARSLSRALSLSVCLFFSSLGC